jgi:hypothetical protein
MSSLDCPAEANKLLLPAKIKNTNLQLLGHQLTFISPKKEKIPWHLSN